MSLFRKRSKTSAGDAAAGSGAYSAFVDDAAAAATVGLAPEPLIADATAWTDVQVAIEVLRKEFPKLETVGYLPPIVLKNQLYALVASRTDVDREVDRLNSAGELHIIRFSEGDVALVKHEDYVQAVDTERVAPVSDGAVTGKRTRRLEVLDAFLSALSLFRGALTVSAEVLFTRGLHDPDLVLLVQMGFLLAAEAGLYQLSVPRIGMLRAALLAGRRELAMRLRRRPFHEMPLTKLEAVKLRRSVLPVRFILRDMLGSGDAVQVGDVVRLTRTVV